MIKAFVWVLMMLIWLGGLIFAVWWVWPRFEQPTFSAELVMIVLWLAMGTATWLLAFNMGRRRYWRR